MRWNRTLELLQVHCQGEIGKVLVSGAPEIPGATLLDRMNHINTVDDSLRRFVTFEPRANVAMTVNLLQPPVHPEADAGFIVLQADRAHPMSGSNCICVVTALLETGRLKMVEPETIVRLDTPAGLITARAQYKDGRCLSVSLDNVPAFVEMLDLEIETPQWGRIKADIAFGGVFYALVDVEQIGLSIEPVHARALAEAGIALRHVEQGLNVAMYRSNIPTRSVGVFHGPTVVSMRPLKAADAIRAVQITARTPQVHGAPIHIGDPALIGIADLNRPDYGDAVAVHDDELPVFWACGVTPQAAIAAARPAFCITHAPGHMLVTDRLNRELRQAH